MISKLLIYYIKHITQKVNKKFECTFDTIKDRYQSIIDELNLSVDLTEEFENY